MTDGDERSAATPPPSSGEGGDDPAGCTLFVGNVALGTTRRQLRGMFALFGRVMSVRLRSVPCVAEIARPTTAAASEQQQLEGEGQQEAEEQDARPSRWLPRRVAVIQRRFAAERNSMNAYVCMASREQAARAAAAINGRLADGLHWRVDVVGGAAKDASCAVFVGGLPLRLEDEQLREHFAACGRIVSVRVVRDRQSPGMVNTRGFGYVNFERAAGARAALLLDGSELLHRQIRVQPHSGQGDAGRKPRHRTREEKQARTGSGDEREGGVSGGGVAGFAGKRVADDMMESLKTAASKNGKQSRKQKKKPRWDETARENRRKRQVLAATLPSGGRVVKQAAAGTVDGRVPVNKKIVFSSDDTDKLTDKDSANKENKTSRLDKLHQIRQKRKEKAKKKRKAQANVSLKNAMERGNKLAALLPKSR